MEGKFELQFEDGEYYLVDGNSNDTVATTDKVLLKKYDGYMKKLSLKNCEAVANGYDLDELAEEYAEENAKDDNISHHNLYTPLEYAYRYGFQKALEILGGKKFSINEVVELSKILISNPIERCGKTPQELVDAYVKSLQQTEWDVSFNSDEKDSEGCLILKRKLIIKK